MSRPGDALAFNPDALPADAKLSDLAARVAVVLMVMKLQAADGERERADAVAELERLAPKLKRNVVGWELERRRSGRQQLATVVRRLLGRPAARARGRRARRATQRRAPARSPGSREPERPRRPLDEPGAAA